MADRNGSAPYDSRGKPGPVEQMVRILNYGFTELTRVDPIAAIAIQASLMLFAMLCGVLLLPAKDVFQLAGLFIVGQGLGCLAVLLLFFGLRRVMGPASWIERVVATRWRRVLLAVTTSTLVMLLCWAAV